MNMCLVTDALMSTKLIDTECQEDEVSACRVPWLTSSPLKSSFKEILDPLSNNCKWLGFPHEICRYLFADYTLIPYLPFPQIFFFLLLLICSETVPLSKLKREEIEGDKY